MQVARFLKDKAPWMYFSAVWVSISFPSLVSARIQGLLPLLVATGFIGMMFIRRKSVNLLIGILMFFWSILILFAYLSDASKPGSANPEAWRFLIFGGLISVLNFLMSSLIVKKSINNTSLTTDSLNATAI
ncbi:MAG TPA: hypothetical protein VGD40_12355 [Chryseosolibacter sp.]